MENSQKSQSITNKNETNTNNQSSKQALNTYLIKWKISGETDIGTQTIPVNSMVYKFGNSVTLPTQSAKNRDINKMYEICVFMLAEFLCFY